MDSNTIIIERKDDVYLKVYTEPGIAHELSEYFTFLVPGHLYMPAFKNKMWDGSIKLFSLKNHTLYLGLGEELYKFAEKRKYEIIEKNPDPILPFDYKDAEKFFGNMPLRAHGKTIKARDYQIEGLSIGASNRRAIIVSPTASGKSLIIYGLIRYFMDHNKDKKVLIVVPTTNLVDQLYSDFGEYSESDPDWDVEECHKIHSGATRNTDKQVIISTWQSLYKQPAEYFKDFGMMIGDECHLFQANSLKGILEKLINCPYKIGTTGTLQEAKTHKLVLQGLFGSIHQIITTKELMDRKEIADLQITCLLLKYDEQLARDLHSMDYDQEMNFLEKHEKRNRFIKNLTISLKGNTLLLFRKIEHGKLLHKIIKEKVGSNRNVYLVYGKTPTEDRESVRKIIEQQDNAIIVGSYGTLSTGADIQSLHNTVFASPYKSKIKNLQSIGRGLRKNDVKLLSNLYDIGDDLSYTTKRGNIKQNTTLRHYLYRVSLYISEKFNYRTIRVNI